jgi:carbamoyltransferase
MKFLGLRLCEHDSNITYTNNTQVKYYKSERDYQVKHHGFNDLNQWTKVIKKWDVNPGDLDAIAIVIDDFLHPWIKCTPGEVFEYIDIPLFKDMGFNCPILRVDHHYSHILSAWPLGINPDVGFVFDGFGDDKTSHSIFRAGQKTLSYDYINTPSLGMIMAAIGQKLELPGCALDLAGKVMAIKGYGRLNKREIQVQKQNLKEINIHTLNTLWKPESISGNLPHDEIFDHIQLCHEISEEVYVNHFCNFSQEEEIICYSGGVAQNTIINSKIKKMRPNLHIPPHCNDEGLSLGAVELLRIIYGQEPFEITGFPYWQDDELPKEKPTKNTISQTAELLAHGKIVGWYQGNGEIGSRALGNRSILMSPAVQNGKQILNDRVKHREWFRPFGASILEEKTSEFFDCSYKSPYMLYVVDVFDKESFKPITHVDGTCRIQTVSSDLENYYDLISQFEKLTGIPMLLNTSLNNGGRAICGSINDALEFFHKSDLDALVVGDKIYQKS